MIMLCRWFSLLDANQTRNEQGCPLRWWDEEERTPINTQIDGLVTQLNNKKERTGRSVEHSDQ